MIEAAEKQILTLQSTLQQQRYTGIQWTGVTPTIMRKPFFPGRIEKREIRITQRR